MEAYIIPLADASKRGLASDDSAWITGEQILAGGGPGNPHLSESLHCRGP